LSISVIVVARDTLLRFAMKACLEGANYQICREAGSIAEATQPRLTNVDLVIVLADLDREAVTSLDEIKTVYPDARLIVFARTLRMPTVEIISMLATKLDGILTSEMSKEAACAYIDCVMSGGRIIPFRLIAPALSDRRASLGTQPQPTGAAMLSERERQILTALLEGLPNKAIARRLEVSPPTVKIHMHALFLKIGAANRTQAALWAHDNFARLRPDARSSVTTRQGFLQKSRPGPRDHLLQEDIDP
jgi:DNA-binding NarL/FixJ family response regulator